MAKELVINTTSHETRVALIENGHIAELYIERNRERGIVGNIYQGKVIRVLPGMQAAFVDIGLEKAAFLYVADVLDEMEAVEQFVDGQPQHARPADGSEEGPVLPPIEELLDEGEELLVQIAKEPLGTKGARITSHISLPGRHLVYMPTVDHIGISRRIENEEEKDRLRGIIEAIRPPGTGFIVRTAAEGKSDEDLLADMEFLVGLWQDISRRRENRSAPALIHSDLDVTSKVLRDILTEDVDRIVVDSQVEHDKIVAFIDTFMPKLKYVIDLYDSEEPIFDAFGLEVEIARALGRKVWLKSGGYIIIEQTEALTAIDVNTGRFVGKHNLEDTILKTNLEAVKEIAFQLRLRNIGGLIIIDFIDMEKEAHREKVHSALEEALRIDKAKTNILKISELGLAEMTRKRV
ncbi:MAG: ribonuclease G, partial [Desulfuromonadales bacterium GWC2_61_20]